LGSIPSLVSPNDSPSRFDDTPSHRFFYESIEICPDSVAPFSCLAIHPRSITPICARLDFFLSFSFPAVLELRAFYDARYSFVALLFFDGEVLLPWLIAPSLRDRNAGPACGCLGFTESESFPTHFPFPSNCLKIRLDNSLPLLFGFEAKSSTKQLESFSLRPSAVCRRKRRDLEPSTWSFPRHGLPHTAL